MFLSCEDRANLRTLQIIETEKHLRVNISSLFKEEKDNSDILWKDCSVLNKLTQII